MSLILQVITVNILTIRSHLCSCSGWWQDCWWIWVHTLLPALAGVSELWLPLLRWLSGQRVLGCVCCSLLQVVRDLHKVVYVSVHLFPQFWIIFDFIFQTCGGSFGRAQHRSFWGIWAVHLLWEGHPPPQLWLLDHWQWHHADQA